MNILKRLTFWSAALAVPLVFAGAAGAADAPRQAVKGKEPVYRCDTAGFIEYPGSDVCFKIGGRLYAYTGFHEDQVDGVERYDPFRIRANMHTRNDTFWMGTRARIDLDVRQATEYGIVRVFMELQAVDNGTNDGGPLNLRHAFIQVGNWLMGKTSSTFYFGPTAETFVEALPSFPGEQHTRINQLRYTASLDGGVRISVAIEDPLRLEQTPANYTAVGLTSSRNEVPDLVAAINVRGDWGQAQASVSAHQHSYMIGAASERRWGWAGQLGLALNVPGSDGDVVYVQGAYAHGHSGALVLGTGLSVGLTALGAVDAVEGWAAIGGYKHQWSKTLRSTLAVAHADIDFNNVVVAGTTLEKTTVVWGNLVWTPVRRLDLGVEVYWGQTQLVNGTRASGMGAAAQAVRSF